MIRALLKAALAAVAPWAAAALEVGKIVLAVIWGFVRQPPGSYIALLCAGAVAWWWSGSIGYHRGGDACEAANKAAAQHEGARQAAVGKQVRKDSDARTVPHETENTANRQTVRTIYVHDQALPDAAYVCVDPVDADRLRALH